MKKTLFQLTSISVLCIALTTNLNAQWTHVGSVTYLTNGTDNVGIGTTAPSYKLDIKNAANCNFRVQSITSGSSNLILARATNTTNCLVNYKTGTTDKWFTGCKGNDDFSIQDALGNPTVLISQTTKYVGIGTITPAAALDVRGRTGIGDTLAVIQGIVGYTGTAVDVTAVLGDAASNTAAGFGYGVQGIGGFIGTVGVGGFTGVYAESAGSTDTTSATGFLSHGVDAIGGPGNESVGIYAQAGGGRFNYGIIGLCGPNYSPADSDDTHKNWAGYYFGDIVYSRAFRWSDAKLKNNIQPIESALEKLGRVQTSTYTFKTKEYSQLDLPAGPQIGFIAENMESVFPDLVRESRSPTIAGRDRKVIRESVTFKTVNYEGILPVVVAAINEQKQVIDQKEAQMNARIAQLENQIAELRNMLAGKQATISETGYLMQNVPNPANGTTSIQFSLPENSKGVLQVTDVNGKVVKSFTVEGSGMQKVEFNTAALSSGTYTYQLTIDGKVADSKNMVITK